MITEPTTEAGRVLLREHSSGTPHMARHILAIEAEAASPSLDRLRDILHERYGELLAVCDGFHTEHGDDWEGYWLKEATDIARDLAIYPSQERDRLARALCEDAHNAACPCQRHVRLADRLLAALSSEEPT